VSRYTLTSGHGVRVRILTYGGIVQSIEVPDRTGHVDDVVLGLVELSLSLLGGEAEVDSRRKRSWPLEAEVRTGRFALTTAPNDDVVLTHHRVSCFRGTELGVVLRGASIDTVVVAGVATNLAVESTARASADLGYRTVVVSDACSTTSETAHNASLASMAMLAEIVTTDDLLATLDRQTLKQPPPSLNGVKLASKQAFDH
jgi:hypothetical protein